MTRSRQIVLALVTLLLLGLVVTRWLLPSVSASGERDNESLTVMNGTTCGVERWHVKTGIDVDARSVALKHVVLTNVPHMRGLPAPASLPPNSRIRPVELTVYQISAFLIRFKEESDSDYHLVLQGAGRSTMIAEIPDPNCVGSSSPFRSAISTVRTSFTRKFHPTVSWQRGKWAVTLTGVGFFDFKHGQSGVAPNAIELHPVLSIRYGTTGGASTPPPPPKKKPTPKPAGGLHMSVSISPNPVPYGAHPTLTVIATKGASCTADVLYSTGRRPVSFNGSAQTVGSGGSVSWSWHMESKGTSGTATVTCSLGGRHETQAATFGIVH